MEEIVIVAKKRELVGKHVKTLRRKGTLPAVVYGPHISPAPISLDYREANRILPTVTSSQLVVVDVEGEKHTVLVKEKQRHPVMGLLQHVDFMAVSMTDKLRVNVLVELRGDAPAVKDYGGILVSGLEVVEIECLPRELPERIIVDISGLREIGDAIHVKALEISDKVSVLTDPEEMIVIVTAPAAEEEEVAEVIVAEGGEEPEVIEKGKKEEEEEEKI